MSGAATYTIYRTSINQLIRESQRLPSLPALTLKIRTTLASDHVNHKKLGELISQDPSLCVHIMREVQSPLYKTQEKPTSLFDAIRILGLENLERISTLHGLKSLFIFQQPKLQKLFDSAWKRQAFKAAICRQLALTLGYRPIDEAVATSLLTEVGTLAILSALTDVEVIPEESTYIRLCNEYSQSLGAIILKKWDIGDHYQLALKNSGDWNSCLSRNSEQPELADIVNLGLYHSIALRTKTPNLPPLNTLPLYQAVPLRLRQQGPKGLLTVVTDNLQSILDDTKSMLR